MNPVGKPGKTGSLMPVEVALARLLEMAEATPIRERERLPLAQVQGRVLADDLISTLDLPPWPNSAMDGYALRLADWTGEPLVVSQKIFAGRRPSLWSLAPVRESSPALRFRGRRLRRDAGKRRSPGRWPGTFHRSVERRDRISVHKARKPPSVNCSCRPALGLGPLSRAWRLPWDARSWM